MKLLFCFLFFVCMPAIWGQNRALPNRIIFNYYYGGDYRNDTLRGVKEIKDSVVYTLDVDKSYYSRGVVTYLARIKRVIGEPKEWYILSNTANIEDYKEDIPSRYISLLVEDLDTFQYEISTIDSISIDDKKEPVFQALPLDFSLDYYMIDSLYFGCLCEYYRTRLDKDPDFFSEKKCEEGIPFNKLLGELLKAENSYQMTTSYMFSLRISLEYDDYELRLSRSYMDVFPATRWSFYNTKTEESYNIINSNINETMMRIFPKDKWKTWFKLENYKNPEELYRFYLKEPFRQ